MRSLSVLPLLLLTVHWEALAQRSGSGSLVVMFDVSASMGLGDRETEPFLGAVRDGLLTRLTPQDRVAIGVFASEIRLASSSGAATRQLDELRQIVSKDADWRYGPSRLWDAVEAGVAMLETEPRPRVVVVVSDGEASGNESGSAHVAEKLRIRDVSLWVVSFRPGLGDSRLRAFAIGMQGRVFAGYMSRQPDPQRTGLAAALAEVLDAFRRAGRSRS